VVYQQNNKNKIKMADLLGQMNTQMVSAYARSKQYEMPSVVAMAEAFDPVIDKARKIGETAIIARKSGMRSGKEMAKLQVEELLPGTDYLKDAPKVSEDDPNVSVIDENFEFSSPVEDQEVPMIGRTSKIGFSPSISTTSFDYSPLKQQDTPPKERSRFVDTTTADYLIEKGPTRPDYKVQLNKLVTQPNITELTIENFNAQKEVLEQAINTVVENPAAQEQAIAFMNTLRALNEEEKETKKLVVENAPNISRGAEESSTKIIANYLNPANKIIMALDPSTNTYQYITETPEGNITKEKVLEVLNTATTNDEAKASYLKSTNSIIKDERDATSNKPKDMNYFNALAKNIVEANPNKIIDLIYGDIREGGNFADDLRQNPEMSGLPDELKEQTYNAIINPDNPNFNRDVTNGLLQQYFALDFKKTYDSVSNQPKAGENNQKSIDDIIKDSGITKEQFPDLF
jgi:hypothetical protein